MSKKFVSTYFNFLCLIAMLFVLAIVAAPQSKKERRQAEQLVQDGNKAFNQKNYRTAIDDYTKSIAIVPASPAAHYWKGYSHYNLKEFDDAVRELDIAMSQGFKPLDVYRVRSMSRYEKKDFDGALADFREGLKLEPDNQMFLRGVGAVTYAQGNFTESLNAYPLALAKDPTNADLYYQLSSIEYKLQDTAG